MLFSEFVEKVKAVSEANIRFLEMNQVAIAVDQLVLAHYGLLPPDLASVAKSQGMTSMSRLHELQQTMYRVLDEGAQAETVTYTGKWVGDVGNVCVGVLEAKCCLSASVLET